MVMGRPNKGVGHVDAVAGSPREKARLRAILRTLGGERSVEAAAADLGIRSAQFAALRKRALQGAADALVPRPPGRPRLCDVEESEQVRELREEVARLRAEVARANVRAEAAALWGQRDTAPEKRGGALTMPRRRGRG